MSKGGGHDLSSCGVLAAWWWVPLGCTVDQAVGGHNEETIRRQRPRRISHGYSVPQWASQLTPTGAVVGRRDGRGRAKVTVHPSTVHCRCLGCNALEELRPHVNQSDEERTIEDGE
ncbi:unnamed protein product, partial [Iphiclides podalirius]